MGSYCLTGAEFLFGLMGNFWRWLVVTDAQRYACAQCGRIGYSSKYYVYFLKI